MSQPARLRVYRFDPGTVFEGGLVGAVERMQLGRDAKLLDALFVTHEPASGGLAAVDLASGGAGGTFASMLDFRLDASRRQAITECTLAEHRGSVPRTLIEAIATTLEPGAAIFAVLHTGGAPTVLDDAVARCQDGESPTTPSTPRYSRTPARKCSRRSAPPLPTPPLSSRAARLATPD